MLILKLCLQYAMTPANSDKNLNIYVKTPTTVRSNRMYGTGKITTDSKKTYLAGCGLHTDLDHIFGQNL